MKKTRKAKKIELLDEKLTFEEKAERAKKAFNVNRKALYTVLMPRMVANIQIPAYQREPIPAHVKRIREALLKGEIIPPLILTYHPDENDGKSFEELASDIKKCNTSTLSNVKFTVIDGDGREADRISHYGANSASDGRQGRARNILGATKGTSRTLRPHNIGGMRYACE